jgi:bacteriorhodopsin
MLLAAIQAAETVAKSSSSIEFFAIVAVFAVAGVFMVWLAMSRGPDDHRKTDKRG